MSAKRCIAGVTEPPLSFSASIWLTEFVMWFTAHSDGFSEFVSRHRDSSLVSTRCAYLRMVRVRVRAGRVGVQEEGAVSVAQRGTNAVRGARGGEGEGERGHADDESIDTTHSKLRIGMLSPETRTSSSMRPPHRALCSNATSRATSTADTSDASQYFVVTRRSRGTTISLPSSFMRVAHGPRFKRNSPCSRPLVKLALWWTTMRHES